MQAKFKRFENADFNAVCDFFNELNNDDRSHINWNWQRWEWMYFHSSYDKSNISLNGLWLDGKKIVGAAIYDHYLGEAFAGSLLSARELLPDIIGYAVKNLQDDDGIYISAGDDDEYMKKLLLEKHFYKTKEYETVLRLDLHTPLKYTEMPDGIRIEEVRLPRDFYNYQLVLWKGFDNGDNLKEFEQSLAAAPEPKRPHAMQFLRLAAVNDKDEFISFCQCWYREDSEISFVGPVCTVPEYRGKGIASSLLKENLSRCYRLGAKEAFVLSDGELYKKIGFEVFSRFGFYWIKS